MDDKYWRGVCRDWKALCDLGFPFLEVGILSKPGTPPEEIPGKTCSLSTIKEKAQITNQILLSDQNMDKTFLILDGIIGLEFLLLGA